MNIAMKKLFLKLHLYFNFFLSLCLSFVRTKHVIHLVVIFIFSVLLLKVFPYGWDYVSGIWFSAAENIRCNVHKGNLQHTLKISCR